MPPQIWLTNGVLARCSQEASRAHPDETGGVIMGWHRPDDEQIVVVHAVGPGPDSLHGERTFRPDNAHHTDAIGDVYQRSGRKVTYLGDWHTHPGGTPSPSRTDIRTLGRIAEHEPSRCPEPVMLIFAGSPEEGWAASGHIWSPRALLRWQRPGCQRLKIRTWQPEPDELVCLGYPFRSPDGTSRP